MYNKKCKKINSYKIDNLHLIFNLYFIRNLKFNIECVSIRTLSYTYTPTSILKPRNIRKLYHIDNMHIIITSLLNYKVKKIIRDHFISNLNNGVMSNS